MDTKRGCLNLSDFVDHRIDAESFLVKTSKLRNVRIVLIPFFRFKGESDTGVIKLTQAMVAVNT